MAKNTQAIKVVEELNGWMTPKKAAELLGLAPASMHAKMSKLDVIKIGGINLISRKSVEQYAEERKAQGLDSEFKANLAKLASILSPDEVKAMLESHQTTK